MKEKALALAPPPLPFFGKRGRKSNLNRTKLFSEQERRKEEEEEEEEVKIHSTSPLFFPFLCPIKKVSYSPPPPSPTRSEAGGG